MKFPVDCQVSLENNIFKNQGPGKNLVSLGVTASCECPDGNLLIGGGDGTLVVILANPGQMKANPKALKPMVMLASTKVQGAVTSIAMDEASPKSCTFYVGTAACNMYKVTYDAGAAKYAPCLDAPTASSALPSTTHALYCCASLLFIAHFAQLCA